MAGRIEARLKELEIVLPAPPAPVASYVPAVIAGNLVFISGQVTLAAEGLKYVGTVGKDVSLEEGRSAARLCAINVVAQLKAALEGDLDVEIFGDAGRHARAAVGAGSLPRNVAAEVEAIFEFA
jgi:enamine deaminase RidA (YjgF/YER057c/UK114 family)